PFFTLDDHEPGDTVPEMASQANRVRLEIHNLYPLKSATLFCRGTAMKTFDVAGKVGEVQLTEAITALQQPSNWYVVRVEDERGNWAITSPVYAEYAEPVQGPFASALLL